MVGQKVGSYVILSLIGDGGMGTVYLGEHERLRRKVAIKMLHPHLSRKPGISQRFFNEAKTLARLQHPNIVALYDYIEKGDELFLIMEYVQGQDLEALIQNKYGPIPGKVLDDIFRQILDAMTYAHSQNVVHRDIKPSNFILSENGQVKVLDFGIAKIMDEIEEGLTKTGTRLGTPFYMSPEQVQGAEVGIPSDIYSLGVLLFALSTGKMPYRDLNSEFEVFREIVSSPLPQASSLYPGVSKEVERVISKAMEKRPEDRFRDCASMWWGDRSELLSAKSSQTASPNAVKTTPPPLPSRSAPVTIKDTPPELHNYHQRHQPPSAPPQNVAARQGVDHQRNTRWGGVAAGGMQQYPVSRDEELQVFINRNQVWCILMSIAFFIIPGLFFAGIAYDMQKLKTLEGGSGKEHYRYLRRIKKYLFGNFVMSVLLAPWVIGGFGLVYSFILWGRISDFIKRYSPEEDADVKD